MSNTENTQPMDPNAIEARRLYDRVNPLIEAGKPVSPEDARRFLAYALYGEFRGVAPHLYQNPGQFDVGPEEGAAEGVSAVGRMPVLAKVALYESIAADVRQDNLLPLAILNDQMGLTSGFYEQHAAAARDFFSPEALGKDPMLRFEIGKVLTDPGAMSDVEKLRLLQDVSNKYCDACGIQRSEIKLIAEVPELQGQYSPADGSISFNVNAPNWRANFGAVFNTAIHEITHGRQNALAQGYAAGQIRADNPNYVAARVFHANFKAGGYISSDAHHGAYEGQPVEIGARVAGGAAETALSARLYEGFFSNTRFSTNPVAEAPLVFRTAKPLRVMALGA